MKKTLPQIETAIFERDFWPRELARLDRKGVDGIAIASMKPAVRRARLARAKKDATR